MASYWTVLLTVWLANPKRDQGVPYLLCILANLQCIIGSWGGNLNCFLKATWCRRATNHYLIQYWLRCVTSYIVTSQSEFNHIIETVLQVHIYFRSKLLILILQRIMVLVLGLILMLHPSFADLEALAQKAQETLENEKKRFESQVHGVSENVERLEKELQGMRITSNII